MVGWWWGGGEGAGLAYCQIGNSQPGGRQGNSWTEGKWDEKEGKVYVFLV